MPTSIPEVREQLVYALTLRNNPLALRADLLEDFARIGSFLTDEAACRPYLAPLEQFVDRTAREGKARRWAGLVFMKND
jgi:hypothetical protein